MNRNESDREGDRFEKNIDNIFSFSSQNGIKVRIDVK